MRPVLPGATLGILGGGQLGRMLAFEAKRLGYRVHVFSPGEDTPAGQVGDLEHSASYEDEDSLHTFAKHVDVVTLEFENIPVTALKQVARYAPVHPHPEVLHIAQHRLREKSFLADQGLPVTPFEAITDLGALEPALSRLGTPAVMKTAGFGYDGKGQRVVKRLEEAHTAYKDLGGGTVILEAFIDYVQEVSVVAARSVGGYSAFGVIENDHRNHILDVSVSPSSLPAGVQGEAQEIARATLDAFDLTGVMCVEMFLTQDARLLINEVAPRPHNSGHLTIEACVMSQFEQQLRAVCGLPLGDTDPIKPAAMANLLGDLWQQGKPDWQAALKREALYLHLYGKAEARPSRKMGHLTALADSVAAARAKVLEARASLGTDR